MLGEGNEGVGGDDGGGRVGEAVREDLESRLDAWRAAALAQSRDVQGADEVESDLRREAHALLAAGLDVDEAFLVALKRTAERHPLLAEYARDYAETFVAVLPQTAESAKIVAPAAGGSDFLTMLACAAGAALAVKVPALFGYQLDGADSSVYFLNVSFFVLPFLLIFFARRHRPPRGQLAVVAGLIAAGAAFANLYPFVEGGSTQALTAIHLPITLWIALGVVHAAGDWRSAARRMEYVRFTGEWFVTYVLIALGGGVLSALTIGVFEAIGVSAEQFVSNWLLPCGAMAAVLVAAWLVETRRNLVGGLAPMLARVFTPLFAVMLVALLVGVVWSKGFLDVGREVLILFDLLLVVVLAMLLYAFSARDRAAAPDLFDRVQLVLIVCALAVDIFALTGIAARTSELGFTPNRTAALGLNLVLLVNLGWSAYLQAAYLRARRQFADIVRWQMRYVPLYALWTAMVAIVFPPLFGFA